MFDKVHGKFLALEAHLHSFCTTVLTLHLVSILLLVRAPQYGIWALLVGTKVRSDEYASWEQGQVRLL